MVYSGIPFVFEEDADLRAGSLSDQISADVLVSRQSWRFIDSEIYAGDESSYLRTLSDRIFIGLPVAVEDAAAA